MPSYYQTVSTNDSSEVLRMSWSQGLELSVRTSIFHWPMVVELLRKHYYQKLLQVVMVQREFLALLLKATSGATTYGEGWEKQLAGWSKTWLSDVSSVEAIVTTSKMMVRLPCVAYQRSRSCGWIPMRFWTPDCSWQLSLGPLAFKKELHCLRRLMLLGVPASPEKPKVAVKIGGPVRSRDEGPSHELEQKVKVRSGVWTRYPRSKGKDLSWRINRWENSIVFSIAFSLPTNEYLLLASKKLIPYLYLHLCTCFVLSKKINLFSSGKFVCTTFQNSTALCTWPLCVQSRWAFHPL